MLDIFLKGQQCQTFSTNPSTAPLELVYNCLYTAFKLAALNGIMADISATTRQHVSQILKINFCYQMQFVKFSAFLSLSLKTLHYCIPWLIPDLVTIIVRFYIHTVVNGCLLQIAVQYIQVHTFQHSIRMCVVEHYKN